MRKIRTIDAIISAGGRRALGVALALLCGLAMAVQASVNARLAGHTGDPLLVAVISFASGLVLLGVVLPFAPGMRAGVGKVRAALRDAVATGGRSGATLTLRRWHLFGGLGGATVITGQAGTVGVLGVAMFTVGVVAGQTVSGMIVDKVGLGPAGVRPVTRRRITGGVLMFVAVVVTTSGGLALIGAQTWLLVFPLLGGLAIAVQQAINGRVGAVADNPLTATLANFTVGTVALTVVWLVSLIRTGGPDPLPGRPGLYVSGVIGVAVIATSALVVRWIGVLLLGLAAVAGQLVGSLLLDALAPSNPGGVAASTVAGVVLALVAIGVASGRHTALRE